MLSCPSSRVEAMSQPGATSPSGSTRGRTRQMGGRKHAWADSLKLSAGRQPEQLKGSHEEAGKHWKPGATSLRLGSPANQRSRGFGLCSTEG